MSIALVAFFAFICYYSTIGMTEKTTTNYVHDEFGNESIAYIKKTYEWSALAVISKGVLTLLFIASALLLFANFSIFGEKI